jgi:hypothetical protein
MERILRVNPLGFCVRDKHTQAPNSGTAFLPTKILLLQPRVRFMSQIGPQPRHYLRKVLTYL